MRVQKSKQKNKRAYFWKKNTISLLEKWSYEYRVETETKKTKNETSEQNIIEKKRYIGWLCEHFNETLKIPKKLRR